MAPYAKEAASKRLKDLIEAKYDGERGSHRRFADEVGIDPVTLSRLVNGKSDLRRSPNLGEIARGLGVGEEEILYGRAGEAADEESRAWSVRESPAVYGSSSDEETANALLGSEETIRRVTDQHQGQTRVSIVRAYEDVLLARGIRKSSWPRWFVELTERIYNGG